MFWRADGTSGHILVSSTPTVYSALSSHLNFRFSIGSLQYINLIVALRIKPIDALNYKFIGVTTVHVSGSLSAHHQEFLALHRHWYSLFSCVDRLLPGAGWNYSSIQLLVANVHHNCIKCTNADVRLRTPDDGRKGCPKHVAVRSCFL